MEAKRVSSIQLSSEEYPYLDKPKHPNHVDIMVYRKLMRHFMRKLAAKIITTGKRVKIPYAIGSLQAVRYKQQKKIDKRPIDFNKTREIRKKTGKKKTIKHSNMATGGYWCRIHWYKKPLDGNKWGATFKHARNYRLKLTRPNLRPNPYNTSNPEVSLYTFFRDKGWKFYHELPSPNYYEQK